MEHRTHEDSIEKNEDKKIISYNRVKDNSMPEFDEHSEQNKEKGKLLFRAAKQTFSGPLPHPEILAGYEKVCPGAADRIIKMAENQMGHRHEIESSFLKAHSRNSKLGIIFAFILCLLSIAGGIICVALDKQVSGLILGGAGLVGIIVAFINGTKMTASDKNVSSDKEENND